VQRHQREIAPLLKDRHIFAESTHFVLYDFWTGYGTVNENVFAYSNRHDGQRAVILYNNSYGSAEGTIHTSVGSMDKGSGEMRQRTLAEGLALPWDDQAILSYRDSASGLEYLRWSHEIFESGMSFSLRGYQYVVLLHWRELHSSQEWPWDRLCDELHGAGVPDLDEAIINLRLRPLHEALRQALSPDNLHTFAAIALESTTKPEPTDTSKPDTTKPGAPDLSHLEIGDSTISTGKPQPTSAPLKSTSEAAKKTATTASATKEPTTAERLDPFFSAAQSFFEKIPSTLATAVANQQAATHYRKVLETTTTSATHLIATAAPLAKAFPTASLYLPTATKPSETRDDLWAPILAWIILHGLPGPYKATLFDRLQLRAALAEIFPSFGLHGEDAWRAAARVRLLLAAEDEPTKIRPEAEHFWADPDVRWLAGVNQSQGETWFNKEAFEQLVLWLHLPILLKPSTIDPDTAITTTFKAAETAGYNVDKLLEPPTIKPTTSREQPTTNS